MGNRNDTVTHADLERVRTNALARERVLEARIRKLEGLLTGKLGWDLEAHDADGKPVEPVSPGIPT